MIELVLAVLRGVLPPPVRWVVDVAGDLVEHLPDVIRARRAAGPRVWSDELEEEIRELVEDLLVVEAADVDDERATRIAAGIVELVRLVVIHLPPPRRRVVARRVRRD